MLIYFAVIFFSFLLSFLKLPRYAENMALLLIAIFLCSGYMTGTDWISYEKYYRDVEFGNSTALTKESGYFLIQNLFRNFGVEFWTFHIVFKLLIFVQFVYFVRCFNLNVFLFLALFIPEVGLYLFIDCPFRNLIAISLSLIGFLYLFNKKPLGYFLFATLAIMFHLSAVVLIPIYFLYKTEIKLITLLILTAAVYTIAFNINFLIQSIYLPISNLYPAIGERLKYYFTNPDFISGTINIGSFIRIFILVLLLIFKSQIIANDERRSYIYNLSIFFLLLYPLGVSMKIFQRFSLYLFPFYIFSIIYMIKSLVINSNRYLLYTFFIFLAFFQTHNLITRDFRYIPYSNYIYHYYKKDFPDIEYRYNYNRKNSPYK